MTQQPKPPISPITAAAIALEFAQGRGDTTTPGPQVIELAARLIDAAVEMTVQPEFAVDTDGALSFDLRRNDGQLFLAELDTQGYLDISVYDDSVQPARRTAHCAPANEEQFKEMLD